MDVMGTMRNLEQIREHDDPGGSSRLMSIALGGLATACVLFAVGVLVGRESGPEARAGREDPLARLDALAAPPGERPVTYPDRLLGATPVPGPEAPAGSVASASALGAPPAANTAAAAVPVILPTLAPAARPVLVPSVGASPQGIRLSVTPAAGAPGSALAPAPGAGAAGAPSLAPAGSDGAITVQVSSFRSQAAADAFARRLRERGHRAFVAAPATGANNVTWYRVRVGPFTTVREAANFQRDFEARERMPTILIRPPAA